MGINGKGTRTVAKWFQLIKTPYIYLHGSDIRPIADTSELKGFSTILTETPKTFPKLKKLIKTSEIVICPMPVVRHNPPLLQEAKRHKTPIVNWSDVAKFIRDKIIEKKPPNPVEYTNGQNSIATLEDLFDKLEKHTGKQFYSKALKAAKDSKLLPFYFEKLPFKRIFAVTGTDGKTSTSYMLYQLLKLKNYKVGVVTTVAALSYNGKTEKASETGLHTTTPAPAVLKSIFDEFKARRIDYLILEVSSHALDQLRIAGLKFDAVIITNLTQDHTNYHGNIRNYHLTKSFIVTNHLKPDGLVIAPSEVIKRIHNLNPETKKYKHLTVDIITSTKSSQLKAKSVKPGVQILCKVIKQKPKLEFWVEFKLGDSKTKGQLNTVSELFVHNFSFAAYAIYAKEKIPLDDLARLAKFIKLPTGREQVLFEQPLVIVDFAHTPNALKSILEQISYFKKTESYNRIILVFGTAGERDKDKRPKMGKIAYQLADIIILTAEDPRFESLKDINAQILSGMPEPKKLLERAEFLEVYKVGPKSKRVYSFFEENPNSRVEAIKTALKIAKPNDIVLITGKGHERSLAFKGKEYEYNDIEVVSSLLGNKSNAT